MSADRKGPLGGRDSYIADFDGFSDASYLALAGRIPQIVSSGTFNMLVNSSERIYDERADELLLLDKIIIAAGETSLIWAMSGLQFTFHDSYDAFDIVGSFYVGNDWSNFDDGNGLGPYKLGVITPRTFDVPADRFYGGRLILGGIDWINSDLAASNAVARYFVIGTLLPRSLFLDNI